MEIKVLVDVKTKLGECPTWDAVRQCLFWVDIVDGRLFCCDEFGGNIRAWEVHKKIGSFALQENYNGAIVELEDGLYQLDFETGNLKFICNPEPDLPQNRLNDGRVDRQGRFVFGSMNRLEDGNTASLYGLNANYKIEKLENNINTSNSICWSPDGTKLYFADTWQGEIWSYDYDLETGQILNKTIFCKIDTSDGGSADGSTVDREGYLWNAKVYSGQLVRYRPDGKIDRIIEMPVKKITSAVFGGKNLDVLFVTSMSQPPLPRFPDDNQLRGSVFAIYGLGIQGIADARFMG